MAKTDDPRIELSRYKSITTVALGLLLIVGIAATGSAVAAEENAGQTAGEGMTIEFSPEEPVTGEEVSLEIVPGESDSEGEYHLYYNGSWHAGLNHTHRYTKPRGYYVLAVRLINGEEEYQQEVITVRESEPSNQKPTAAFDHTLETPVVGENVEFNASQSNDSDGSIESYEWDVDGDGDIEANGTTNNYSYDSAGTYEATLTVTDADGATDTANVTVTVESVEASLEPNDDIESATDVGTGASYENLDTNFTDFDLFAVDVEEGETISADIDVRNGDMPIQATLLRNNRGDKVAVESVTDKKSINHTAAEDQTYYLELFGTPVETTTYDLEISTTVKESEPPNQKPTATFDQTLETPVVGENAEFNASASNDSDGSIESYEWDFDGDGEIEANGTTNDYSYDSAGTYDATVTVTDEDGATDTANVTVTVESVEASLESNDDIESATDVGTGASYENLDTKFADRDLFAVDVEEGETISADINVRNGDKPIQATLMRNNRGDKVAVESVTDKKSIKHTAAEDQTYYVELFGSTMETTNYDINITTTG